MFSKRITVIYILLMTFCVTALLRVYVLSSDMLTSRVQSSYAKRSASVTVSNIRGNIYDRNLKPLLYTEEEYAFFIEPQYFVDNEEKTKEFVTLYGLSEKNFQEQLQKNDPFIVRSDYFRKDFLGATPYKVKKRYSSEQLLPHIIGYTDRKGESGLFGIEKAFDEILKTDDKVFVKYVPDALGNSISGLGSELSSPAAQNRQGIKLTIDYEVQKKLESAMKTLLPAGAAIVTEVESGDILAIASTPSFSPANLEGALAGENSELLNRAFLSYNLGSVFKVVVALDALSNGVSPERTYDCTGSITVGGTSFKCHNENGHGKLSMKEALAGSCNPYFISLLCEQQDAERLLSLAKSLGLFEGREFYSGFSVPSGSYPTKIYNEIPAFLGNLAIGQGEILASPLGVAQMMNTVANNGIYVPLNLFSSIVNDNLNDIESLKREEKVRVIDEADAKKVQAMLSTVVSDGTGSGAKIEGLSIAGKTSSAETGWKKKDGTLMVQGWFSGFFPAEKPKYQITVVAEDALSGNRSAAPVFREVAQFLAERDKLILTEK